VPRAGPIGRNTDRGQFGRAAEAKGSCGRLDLDLGPTEPGNSPEAELASTVASRREAEDGPNNQPERTAPEGARAVVPDDLPLPEGSRIVHIGPHKTGTTALQAAFWNKRIEVEEQGVHYASNGRHAMSAVLAGIDHSSPWTASKRPPPRWLWTRLLNDIRSSKAKRVVLSSEYFTDAKPEPAARVVRELDPNLVQIVVTIRPLSRILTSQWQQFVRNQNTTPFDEFLKKHLDDPHPADPPIFWRRHRHDDLVKRWVDLVGPDHVTVVALDDSDHDMVLRAFEQLTGLVAGTLEADPTIQNRSMTLPEIETIRQFNIAFKNLQLPSLLYMRLMRFGATHVMQQRTPEPGEPRIELPDWSVEPIRGIATDIVSGIRATGVRVVGDLDGMLAIPKPRVGPAPDVSVSPEVAASAALGVLIASGLARGTAELTVDEDVEAPDDVTAPRPPSVVNEPPELLRVSSPQMALVLLRRARVDAMNRVRALRGRLPR
jgi:hypothetical protein